MMRTVALTLLSLLLWVGSASAQITVPNTFIASTRIVSADVNQNFSTLGTNALNRTGGTMTGTLTTLGIVPTTNNASDIGASGTRYANVYSVQGNFSGALTAGSTLAVTGATTLSSTLGVTGNTTIGGTLGVTGAATLSSTLVVTGATTLSGAVTASSSVTVGYAVFTAQGDGSSADPGAGGYTCGTTVPVGTMMLWYASGGGGPKQFWVCEDGGVSNAWVRIS